MVVVAAEYAWIDVIEIWTIAVICIMLMGNAGINNAVLARTAVNSQVNNHGADKIGISKQLAKRLRKTMVL